MNVYRPVEAIAADVATRLAVMGRCEGTADELDDAAQIYLDGLRAALQREYGPELGNAMFYAITAHIVSQLTRG